MNELTQVGRTIMIYLTKKGKFKVKDELSFINKEGKYYYFCSKNNKKEKDKVIAEITIVIKENLSELKDLYVWKKHRQKGLAKKIRKKAIQYILKNGIKEIKTISSPYENNISLEKLSDFYKDSFIKNGSKRIDETSFEDYRRIIAFF